MSPWNELVLACNLKQDVPQQILDLLKYIIEPPYNFETQTFEPIPTPEHAFFHYEDWQTILLDDTYYFPGERFASFVLDKQNFYKFTTRTMVRRGDEIIPLFLQWLAPYMVTEGFVGYTRCDEDEQIDLIYFENGDVFYNSVRLWENPPQIERVKINP